MTQYRNRVTGTVMSTSHPLSADWEVLEDDDSNESGRGNVTDEGAQPAGKRVRRKAARKGGESAQGSDS